MKHDTAVRIFVGFIVGVFAGFVFRTLNWQGLIEVSVVLGELFLRALRMVVIPVIFCSLTLAIAQLGDIARLSRLGKWTIAYYLATNAIAVTIGLTLVNIIQPGSSAVLSEGKPPELPPLQLKTLILNIVPLNPMEALVKGEMLSIIFLAILTGAALLTIQGDSEPIQKLLDSALRLTMVIIHWLLAVAPFGVFGLAVRIWLVGFSAVGEIRLDSGDRIDNSRFIRAANSFLAFRQSATVRLPSPFHSRFSDRFLHEFKFRHFACDA